MRIILALILVAVLVAAAIFLADRPGHVEIVWEEWQVETSLGVLVAGLVLAMLLFSGLLGAIAAILGMSGRIRRRRRERARRVGEAALARALVALAAGKPAAAQLEAQRAEGLLGGSTVALLLAAEAAECQGDKEAARRRFAILAEQPETALLGLRGLLGQALRNNAGVTALRLAERAHRLRPEVPWLMETLLELQARAGEWDAALKTLGVRGRRGSIPTDRLRHHRGVVLYELSRAAERRGDPHRAAALAARAQKDAPDLAAIACHHARLLTALGRSRAAERALERGWRAAPRPEMARAYVDFHPEAAPVERAGALERLAGQNPDAIESRLALAEAALAAQLWGEARRNLSMAAAAPTSFGPSRRLCLLIARLEDAEGTGRAREWLDRAIGAAPDPCYVCAACALETMEWQSLCPQCRGFDTLAWRVPERAGKEFGAAFLPPLLLGQGAPLIEPEAAKHPTGLARQRQ
ncbi:MAG TPA: heme biosynthesis HemY N-terminal domain-containing protein [Stellaceae bacterium]